MKHGLILFLFMLFFTGLAGAQTADTVEYWNYKGDGALNKEPNLFMMIIFTYRIKRMKRG